MSRLRTHILSIATIVLLGAIPLPAFATFAGVSTGVFAYHGPDPNSVPSGCGNCSPTQSAIFIHPGGQITFPAIGGSVPELHRDPAYSPDGSKIAFVRSGGSGDGSFAIETMDESGANRVAIVDGSDVAAVITGLGHQGWSWIQFGHPAWSANGQKIVFDVTVAGAYVAGGIWAVGTDGSGLERLVGNWDVDGQRVFSPEWAPYGTNFAFRCQFRTTPSGNSYRDDICVADSATGLLRQIPIDWPDAQSSNMSGGGPKWTPDGARLLFGMSYVGFELFSASNATGWINSQYSRSEIFSVRADGSGLEELTHSAPFGASTPRGLAVTTKLALDRPAMSPDGKSIVARGSRYDSPPAIFMLDANGGNALEVATPPVFFAYGVSALDWQPGQAGLTVIVDDGHDHPLSGLVVELQSSNGDVFDANPTSLPGGRYVFESVPPGDYVLQAKLVDDAVSPTFGIFHAPDNGAGAVRIRKDLQVAAGDSGPKVVSFEASDDLLDTNVSLSFRHRLDDLAFLYFRVSQFVDWVHENLTQATGRPVAFNAFFDADLGSGPYDPDGASYRSMEGEPLAIILLGTRYSEYENRDGISDPGHRDDAPMNGEWHEFSHHLHFELIDSSSCPGINHGGYSNPDTCDSLSEGFAAFIPTVAAQSIEGLATARYAGRWDLEAGGYKAWSIEVASSGQTKQREDVAVAALFWDLFDNDSDGVDTAYIGGNGSHLPVRYVDRTSLSLEELWLKLTILKPSTVSELRQALGSPALNVDLDADSLGDISDLDQPFLMQGFFPVDLEQSIAGHAYHYDAYRAQDENPFLPRNAAVGLSDHTIEDSSGFVIDTFIPRSHILDAAGSAIEIQIRDASDTPLSGATVELTIQNPPLQGLPSAPRLVSQRLETGESTLVQLELPPYYDYSLPMGAPLPPCPPTVGTLTNVAVRVKLNGYTSTVVPSFDNCAFRHAIATASGPSAMSFTMTFPEDSTGPVTTLWKQASVAPIGNGTTGFWVTELDCQDPVTGGFASGCHRTEYRLDGGALTSYSGTIVLRDPGVHVIEFRSEDAAGNVEPFRSQVVGINADPDSDADGLTDSVEIGLGTNFEDADSDDDGLADGAEISAGTNPNRADTDNDRLNDGDEVALGTDPLASDTDGDGFIDGREVRVGLDPRTRDSDGDGISEQFEGRFGTNSRVFDTDGDGRSDGAEVTVGTDPNDPDTDNDDDGIPDLGDNCLLIANPTQPDLDGDQVGDACDLEDRYTTWQLVGVTTEGASVPESLFALDPTDASTTFLMSLGAGDIGDTIAFHPGDGRLYLASGSNDAVWQAIDLESLSVVTSSPFCCSAASLTFNVETGTFVFAEPDFYEFGIATSSGQGGFIGSTPEPMGALAFNDGALYAGSQISDWLYQLAPASGYTINRVSINLNGTYVDATVALATDPSSGELWGIFMQAGQAHLGRIDPTTGIVSPVGVLPNGFSGIAYVPEPGMTESIFAAGLALLLLARRRRLRAQRSPTG